MLDTAPSLFARLLALLAFCAPSSYALQASGDHALLWEHASSTDAFIPGELTFGLHDNHVWSAAGVGSRRVMLFDSVAGPSAPRSEEVLADSSLGTVGVAAPSSGSALFSVSQHGTSNGRRFEFARHDATDSALSSAFAPSWTANATLPGVVSALIETDADGSVLATATWNGTHAAVTLYDGATGALTDLMSFSSPGLSTLEVSAAGDRIALLAGDALSIFDQNLSLVYQTAFATPPSSFSLSGDGRRFAVGFAGRVEVYGEQPVWSQQQTLASSSHWIANQLDLSRDGTSLAIGWWNVSTGSDVRFELRTGPALIVASLHEQFSTSPGLQNLPQAVAITADGQRAAFGCWGTQDANPEVILVDQDESAPILEIDLPGSVRSLDLDSTGTRIAVAHKETHANLVGFRGSVRLYDTEERDLKLRAVPEVSSGLRVWHRPPAVPNVAYLALGRRALSATPLSRGSVLALDRNALRVTPVGSGQEPSEADLPLAGYPQLRGREFAVQMVYRTARGLRSSSSVIEFTLL